jgi:hypothetical protein
VVGAAEAVGVGVHIVEVVVVVDGVGVHIVVEEGVVEPQAGEGVLATVVKDICNTFLKISDSSLAPWRR